MCIAIYKNGDYKRTVTDLNISSYSGVQLAQDQIACFQNFEIPFKCTLRYKTTNKLVNAVIDFFFDFEMLQEGNWDVAVHN
jgi:hypothetical protein